MILVETSKWIGGMMAGGLGCTDKVGSSSYGGIADEFLKRTQTAYGGSTRQPLPHCTTHAAFEPHVATSVFAAMLHEANVTPPLRPMNILSIPNVPQNLLLHQPT